jgi:23S rRNA pseudouridine955/2504/2580 synthase
MAAIQTRTVEADEAGMRLDRWFKAHYPELSFGHLQKLLRSGQVRVDGGRVKTNTRLAQGQAVRVPPLGQGGLQGILRENRPHEGERVGGSNDRGEKRVAGLGIGEEKTPRTKRPATDAEALRAMILYEDDEVFVFNKVAGLAVQGGSGLTKHVDAMLEAFRDRKGQKPRLVHRLDRDTSGVLVVARTRLAASKLAASFRARTTRKIYWALVRGVPKPKQGRISTWLAKEGTPEGDRMRVARHGTDDASHAVSLYSVVDQAGQKLAWLTMRPVTGRTHQLRAHAAHIGHPIIGDPKYFTAEDTWDFPGGVQDRLHLHARRIVIPHPKSGTIDVTAPLPPHMQQSWNLLGFDATMGDVAIDDDSE